ncbi:hypothetical protein BCR42DRAFT_441874 [Absidia repens]|uniref:F-box/LRR-repeat protein 15/At3g58940/PEG3-like LRR domain-containing protein n=1 Tax=Absidia repens TaxID=90262 RepID=A0A1X2I404_9FUNG|nr:hypothetical protein BCR42DRAFT_441874 [Absidia repens]
MISTLPLELFDLISQHLCTQDKYNCLFVCQAWYPVFRLALYQNCVLTTPQAYRSFHSTLQNGQGRLGLGGQVRLLDTSHCELPLQDLKSLFQLCPNVRGSKFRWLDSFLEKDGFENHDQRLLTQAQTTDCQHQHMWDHQPSFPVWPAADTNFADRRQQSQLPPALQPPLLLCGSLTELTLHDADIAGLFSVVTHLPCLEQLYLISTKLDMTLYDLERLHGACPQLSSLSMELHTLLSSSPSITINNDNDNDSPISTTFSMDSTFSTDHMRHLKLVYKKLEKPGRSPWIRYIAHKYPYLTSLEMKTRFVQRQNYWQWNRDNSMDDDQGQQLQLQGNMDDHPEFRYGLKKWAESCHHLTRIHFTGIPWDQWFLKHLPAPIKKIGKNGGHYQQQQQPLPTTTATTTTTTDQHVQHIHVVRVDDNFNAAAATFWTLTNHSALKQLSHLTLRPVSPRPDGSFYKALGQLDSLASLTIHQQGIRSNKLSPCQLDIHQILLHCRKLEALDLGGMAISALDKEQDEVQKQQDELHQHLRSLTLSTTNIMHSILHRIIQRCPSLTRFFFISCEYEASSEYGIPTLAIEHPSIRWKEVHIRYPFIQSPIMEQYHQPMGLSGSRRRGGTPRYLNVIQQQRSTYGDQWIYLDPQQQQHLDSHDIATIKDDKQQQKNLALRKPGLELGRIKIACRSIDSLYINGTQVYLQ